MTNCFFHPFTTDDPIVVNGSIQRDLGYDKNPKWPDERMRRAFIIPSRRETNEE